MVGLMEPDWSLNGSTNQPLGLTEWDKNKISKTVNLFIVSRVTQKQVERLGYLVDTVEDGKAALSALASVHYWVVLMDCEMLELDGYAATGEIRRREGSGPAYNHNRNDSTRARRSAGTLPRGGNGRLYRQAGNAGEFIDGSWRCTPPAG
jgi:Response regulator receiver domain